MKNKWLIYENEMWSIGERYYRERLKKLGLSGLVLDLGCGPGQWSAAAIAEGMKVVGFDEKISKKAVELRRFGEDFNLVQGNAEQLPFTHNIFDIVLCELVFPYIDINECVAEISRILKPGGLVHGICHGPGYYINQAIVELKKLDTKMRRRIFVILYTVIRNALKLKSKCHYETYQRCFIIKDIFTNNDFKNISFKIGGHPIFKETDWHGLTTFFEFYARR